jgi:CHAD domain-containing protein
VDALHRRTELEGTAGGGLDPQAWPESEARDLLVRLAAGQPLAVRFTIRQRRSVRLLHAEDGATAELSLDEAEVRAGPRSAGTFAELEVEAVGEAAVAALLEPIAKALEQTRLVQPEGLSKEATAAAMVMALESAEAGRSAFEALPKTPGVLPDDTLATAGRKVLRLHLARMLALEAGTRSDENAEDLKKMRVATRRMRAAWRVFDGAYKPKVQKRYVDELRDFATALGAVRDLDVLLHGLESYRSGLPAAGAAALEPLAESWRGRREAARRTLMKRLDSRAYASFVADYRDFTERVGAGERTPVTNQPSLVRESAGGRIWQAYEHMRAHDATLRWADTTGLHALRIDAKRLRYALEFFREALPRAQTDRLIAAVTAIQDHLGELNDADIAGLTAREFLVLHGSRLPQASREAIGHFLVAREEDVARLRRTLPPVWRRLSGPTFRRSLASTIASL